MDINTVFDRLFDYYCINSLQELALKLGVSQPAISQWKTRNAISAVKKRCRELGIYNEIFGDLTHNNRISVNNNTGQLAGTIQGNQTQNLKKIDIIPPSLAIAQAAAESAWGKSRFVRDANNIFGHWTYDAEIGLLPKKRTLGSSHFIRIFKNIKESTYSYMLNLNRNLAYKSFQEKRHEQRKKGLKPDGLTLSQTMLNYSGIAQDYLVLLENLILSNNLQEYDLRYFTQNK